MYRIKSLQAYVGSSQLVAADCECAHKKRRAVDNTALSMIFMKLLKVSISRTREKKFEPISKTMKKVCWKLRRVLRPQVDIKDVPEVAERLRKNFILGKSRTVEWRMKQLQGLKRFVRFL